MTLKSKYFGVKSLFAEDLWASTVICSWWRCRWCMAGGVQEYRCGMGPVVNMKVVLVWIWWKACDAECIKVVRNWRRVANVWWSSWPRASSQGFWHSTTARVLLTTKLDARCNCEWNLSRAGWYCQGRSKNRGWNIWCELGDKMKIRSFTMIQHQSKYWGSKASGC